MPDAGEDAIEAAQHEYWPLDPLGAPARRALQRRQDFVEAIAEIREYVVTILARAVLGGQRGLRAADQYGIRQQALEVSFRRQQAFPLG